MINEIDKLQAEIERRLKDYWKICFHDVVAYNEDSNVRELKELLGVICNIKRERSIRLREISKRVKVARHRKLRRISTWVSDTEKELLFEKESVQFCFDKGLNVTPYEAKTIAQHFYELGRNSKPAEWSEEDDGVLEQIITAFHRIANGCEHYFSQDTAKVFEETLISLRPQPKRNCKECAMFLCGECTRPRWKPSEEQMKVLRKYIMGEWKGLTFEQDNILKSLYEQLKKL